MKPKPRKIKNVDFKPCNRRRDPVKLTRKKIAHSGETGRSNFMAANLTKMKLPIATNENKKMAFKRQGQKLTLLLTGSSQLANEFELTFGAQPTRDHAHHWSLVSIHKIGETPCSN